MPPIFTVNTNTYSVTLLNPDLRRFFHDQQQDHKDQKKKTEYPIPAKFDELGLNFIIRYSCFSQDDKGDVFLCRISSLDLRPTKNINEFKIVAGKVENSNKEEITKEVLLFNQDIQEKKTYVVPVSSRVDLKKLVSNGINEISIIINGKNSSGPMQLKPFPLEILWEAAPKQEDPKTKKQIAD